MECVVALFVGERGRDGGGLIVVERSRVVGRFIGIYIYICIFFCWNDESWK